MPNISRLMTDLAIAQEMGKRIEQLRLEQNITQQRIADEVGITVKTYRMLIQGQGKFMNLIAVLRVLGVLEQMDNLIPLESFSPLERLKLEGQRRQRARNLADDEPASAQPDISVQDLGW